MPEGDMIQVHMLTAYPAALLNRDDAGLAKRIPFGGAVRTRVSSQCLKKHWRDAPEIRKLGDMAVRSTRIYEQLVARLLREEHGAASDEASAVARFLMSETVDTKSVTNRDGVLTDRTGQLLVMTQAETRFLGELGSELLRQLREANIHATTEKEVKDADVFDKKALRPIVRALPASIDTALFGRMITSDLFARVDSAVSVAHAFTTHGGDASSETDYFTAVDMLNTDDAGAGLIQDTELTTGVFYSYAVIDMNQLRANLGEQAALAEHASRQLVRVMATVSPGAKRGSTAPFSYAEMVLLERGTEQPRTLGNAFLDPIAAEGMGLMTASVDRLLSYRDLISAMYKSSPEESALATVHAVPDSTSGARTTFPEALDRIFAQES
ncbi:MAG: type I-E CRISPR-associated protein Cas7/Cse4/CasC [Gemmatimonadaceae bacterium]